LTTHRPHRSFRIYSAPERFIHATIIPLRFVIVPLQIVSAFVCAKPIGAIRHPSDWSRPVRLVRLQPVPRDRHKRDKRAPIAIP
jgi:hypothetical protein